MSRVKENKIVRKCIAKSANETPVGSFNQMVAWNLSTIASFLCDISHSLAVIADNTEALAQTSALDKIRAEIKQHRRKNTTHRHI